MISVLPSLAVLGLVAITAAVLAHTHCPGDSRRTAPALLLATMVQAVHFGEEWLAGFHVQFPALFGFPPMPELLFVGFNLAWLVVWLTCIPLLRSRSHFALFAAWFLALAGLLNLVAHPAMALRVGGYFPGLLTAPFIGAAAAWLTIRLRDR